MKVFAIFVFTMAAVSAKGSGPYLPSGWRPEGPAFYLPSEVQKPADNPLQDVILAGSEASGSDALREYGPPKIQAPGIINQGLPDVDVEQNFIEAIFTNENEKEVANIVVEKEVIETEVKSEEISEKSEGTTESQTEALVASDVAPTTGEQSEISGRNLNSDVEAEIVAEIQEAELSTPALVLEKSDSTVNEESSEETTAAVSQESSQDEQEPTTIVTEEQSTEVTQGFEAISQGELTVLRVEPVVETTEKFELATEDFEAIAQGELAVLTVEPTESEVSQTESASDLRSETVEKVEQEVSHLEQVVENIPEVNLENEVKADQVISKGVVDSAILENSGSLEQAPEGFLEYGPPGFKEYGPPKEDLNIEAVQIKPLDTNEARRRRFSPKFKPAKRSH